MELRSRRNAAFARMKHERSQNCIMDEKNYETENKRSPKECANRRQNGFRCAYSENGVRHTPDVSGADCKECPDYVYEPSDADVKKEAADKEAKRGAAIGAAVIGVVALIAIAAVIATVLIIKSCV